MDVRAAFNIDLHEPFPVLEVLENRLPGMIEGYQFEVAFKEDLGDKLAETIPNEQRIRIREDVYNGMFNLEGQHLFTGAHELGHLIFHRNIAPSLLNLDPAGYPAYRKSEWQANTFAAELLMPFDVVRHMDAAEIEANYNVSHKAAMYRVRIINEEEEKQRHSSMKK